MSNVWTIDIEEQDFTKDAGVVVTQGTGASKVSGKLKIALVGDTTTIVVTTTSVIPFSSTTANLVVGDVTVPVNNIDSATHTGKKKHAEYNEEPYNGPESEGMDMTSARALFCGIGKSNRSGKVINGGWGNFKCRFKTIINTTKVTIAKFTMYGERVRNTARENHEGPDEIDRRIGKLRVGNPYRNDGDTRFSYLLHERAYRKETWDLLSKWDAMSRKHLLGDDIVRYHCCTDHVLAGKKVTSGRKINSPLRTSLQQSSSRNRNLEAESY